MVKSISDRLYEEDRGIHPVTEPLPVVIWNCYQYEGKGKPPRFLGTVRANFSSKARMQAWEKFKLATYQEQYNLFVRIKGQDPYEAFGPVPSP